MDIGLLESRESFDANYERILEKGEEIGLNNTELAHALNLINESSLKQSQKSKLINLMIPNELVSVEIIIKIISLCYNDKTGDLIKKRLSLWLLNHIMNFSFNDDGERQMNKLLPWMWNLLKIGHVRYHISLVFVYVLNRVEVSGLFFNLNRIEFLHDLYKMDESVGALIWAIRNVVDEETDVKKRIRKIDEDIIRRQLRILKDDDRIAYLDNLRVYHNSCFFKWSNSWGGLREYVNSICDSSINVVEYTRDLKLSIDSSRIDERCWDQSILDSLNMILLVDQVELEYVFEAMLNVKDGKLNFQPFMTTLIEKFSVSYQLGGHRLPSILTSLMKGEIRVNVKGHDVTSFDLKLLRLLAVHSWIEYLPASDDYLLEDIIQVIAKTKDRQYVKSIIRLYTRWKMASGTSSQVLDELQSLITTHLSPAFAIEVDKMNQLQLDS